jgi:lipopolysaccharide export LptBFGC system permease protein LptF
MARGGTSSGYQWLAVADGKIYSYKYGERAEILDEPTLYQFDEEGIHLREIVRGRAGYPTPSGGLSLDEAASLEGLDKSGGDIVEGRRKYVVDENTQFQLFKPQLKQPNEYDTQSLRDDLKRLSGAMPTMPSPYLNALVVTLWRRRLEAIYPLVMWINALPLALSFGRRSVILPLVYAVILGLCFWLGNAILFQAGVYGLLSPLLSVLILPIMLFLNGVYLLSRART